jgi:hypothetical protein
LSCLSSQRGTQDDVPASVKNHYQGIRYSPQLLFDYGKRYACDHCSPSNTELMFANHQLHSTIAGTTGNVGKRPEPPTAILLQLRAFPGAALYGFVRN